MVFWLPLRYHPEASGGGPRWSKTVKRCKLPVLQHGHLGIKLFFLLFLALFVGAFLVKAYAFDVSKACPVFTGCCSKNHNVVFSQNVWAKYASQNA